MIGTEHRLDFFNISAAARRSSKLLCWGISTLFCGNREKNITGNQAYTRLYLNGITTWFSKTIAKVRMTNQRYFLLKALSELVLQFCDSFDLDRVFLGFICWSLHRKIMHATEIKVSHYYSTNWLNHVFWFDCLGHMSNTFYFSR